MNNYRVYRYPIIFQKFFFYFHKNGIDYLVYIAFCLSKDGIIRGLDNYINCNILKGILLNILYLKFII